MVQRLHGEEISTFDQFQNGVVKIAKKRRITKPRWQMEWWHDLLLNV